MFETLTACRRNHGVVEALHLSEHIARLAESARALGLSESVRTSVLGEAIERTLEKAAADLADVAKFRVRLTITGGDLNILEQGRAGDSRQREQHPTLLIVASPATSYPREMFERGVAAMIADWKANPLDPLQGHKTLNYWPRLRELQRAAGNHASEAIIFQVTNHVCGGCVSNVFVVKNGVLITPIARGEEHDVASGEAQPDDTAREREGAVIPSPVLPGVTRRWVMDWALAEGVEAERRMLTIHDLLGADEILLTNSSWGVLPVVRVEAEKIGTGAVGELGKKLVGAWRELVGG